MTISIITLMGVSLKPILKVSRSLNFSHVRLNTVSVGYRPVAAFLPMAKKYS